MKKPLPQQRERMAAMAMARGKMATVTAELGISQLIRSKLPRATLFLHESCGRVRVYRERDRKMHRPIKVIRVTGKAVTVTDGTKAMTYEISQ